MRKIKLAVVILLSITILASCVPSEKEVSALDVSISGAIGRFLKVVDNSYLFTNDGDDAYITVQFELEKMPDGDMCRKKHPESIRLNPIGNGGNIFDTGIYGFNPSRLKMSKLKELLNNGKVGDRVRVAFTWDYFGVSKDIGTPIFKESASFEIIDNTFGYCNGMSNDDLHWDDGYMSEHKAKNKSRNNCDIALDSYEEYVDQYIKVMKKISTGDESAISEYTALIEKAEKMDEKLAKLSNGFTTAQLNRFTKIQEKMLASATSM